MDELKVATEPISPTVQFRDYVKTPPPVQDNPAGISIVDVRGRRLKIKTAFRHNTDGLTYCRGDAVPANLTDTEIDDYLERGILWEIDDKDRPVERSPHGIELTRYQARDWVRLPLEEFKKKVVNGPVSDDSISLLKRMAFDLEATAHYDYLTGRMDAEYSNRETPPLPPNTGAPKIRRVKKTKKANKKGKD